MVFIAREGRYKEYLSDIVDLIGYLSIVFYCRYNHGVIKTSKDYEQYLLVLAIVHSGYKAIHALRCFDKFRHLIQMIG